MEKVVEENAMSGLLQMWRRGSLTKERQTDGELNSACLLREQLHSIVDISRLTVPLQDATLAVSQPK